MRYRDWTLVVTAVLFLTELFIIPWTLSFMGVSFDARAHGERMGMLEAGEISMAILIFFIWLLGVSAIAISRREHKS